MLLIGTCLSGLKVHLNSLNSLSKHYSEDSQIGCIDAKYPQKLYELHSDLPFLPKRMKLKIVKNLRIICMLKKCKLCI